MVHSGAEERKYFSSLREESVFLGTVALIVALTLLRFPSATFQAEPYAETGTRFFLDALENPFFNSVFLPEFAHRPFLSRLIATVTVQLFGIREWYAVTVQMMTAVLCACAASVVTLTRFRIVISSDLVRSVLAIGLGTHWGWGMYLLHNLGYWAAPIGFLFSVSCVPISLRSMPLLAFAAAILPGKAYSLAFAPFFAWRAVHGAVARSGDGVVYLILIVPILSLFFQSAESPPAPALARLISNSACFFFYLPSELFFGSVLPAGFGPAVGLLGWSVILLAFGIAIYRRDSVAISAALHGGALAAITIMMTVRGFHLDEVNWTVAPPFTDDSHFFFPSVALWLGSGVAFSRSISTPKALVLLVVLIGTSGVFGFLRPNDPYADSLNSVSRWADYASLTKNESYCIPINPEGWYVMRGCDHLREVQGISIDPLTIRYGAGGQVIGVQWLGSTKGSPRRITALLPDGEKVLFRKVSRSAVKNPLFVSEQPVELPFDLRVGFGQAIEGSLAPGSILLFGTHKRD